MNYSCDKEIWEKDKAFGDKMHNVAIPHYKNIWGYDIKITDTTGTDLDKKFSIDFIHKDKHNLSYHCQEKFQRYRYASFKTITIEYMSNVDYKREGSFFHMNVDYYIMGYATKNEDDFIYLWVLKWTDLKRWLNDNFTERELLDFLVQDNEHGRANFLAIPINLIPEQIFVDKFPKQKMDGWM